MLVNPDDVVSLKRIVNTPKRSIGDTSVAHVDRYVEQNGITLLEGLRAADQNDRLSTRAQKSIAEFVSLYDHLAAAATDGPSAALEPLRTFDRGDGSRGEPQGAPVRRCRL